MYFFGIPCPTCGMTRSFFSLIRLDIKKSLEYNPMTVFMSLALWLCLHRKLFSNKRIIDILIIVISFFNFVAYIIRLK
ncbi:MAG: DUF2752 domain-containing protein [Clostridiaceae bacterium]|nr:DUF2752 domain-containing protein [Clostridiaceae bacterium]